MTTIPKRDGNDLYLKSLNLEVSIWEAECSRIRTLLLERGLLEDPRVASRLERMVELLSQIRINEKGIVGANAGHWERLFHDMTKKYRDAISAYEKEIAAAPSGEVAVLQIMKKEDIHLYSEIIALAGDLKNKGEAAIRSHKSFIRKYRRQFLKSYRSLICLTDSLDAMQREFSPAAQFREKE